MSMGVSRAQAKRNKAANWLHYCEAARDNLADKRPSRRGCGFYAWMEHRADRACDKARRDLDRAQAAYRGPVPCPPSPTRADPLLQRIAATHAALLRAEAAARAADALRFT